jgi:hypothetical protein
MNLKLNILVYCILTVFIMSTGCKKDTDKKESCRVTKLIMNSTLVYDIKYGDNEKISSVEMIPGNEKFVYAYEGNKVIITATYNGNFDYRYIVTNNKNGLATNVLMELDESGSSWYNQAFTYEGARVVSNTATKSGGNNPAPINYIWEDGNPAVMISDGDIFNYEYYTDKNYQPGDWRYIQQLIGGYRIYDYKNLFKSAKSTSTTYYTYGFDDAGRITTATSTNPNNTTTFKIEYDCH